MSDEKKFVVIFKAKGCPDSYLAMPGGRPALHSKDEAIGTFNLHVAKEVNDMIDIDRGLALQAQARYGDREITIMFKRVQLKRNCSCCNSTHILGL